MRVWKCSTSALIQLLDLVDEKPEKQDDNARDSAGSPGRKRKSVRKNLMYSIQIFAPQTEEHRDTNSCFPGEISKSGGHIKQGKGKE